MIKILLIEDRVERQELFSKEISFNFQSYSKIIDNKISLWQTNLDQYSTIICHRSAFGDLNSTILDQLKNHCKGTKTQLVFFSGGISSTFYSDTSYEFLLLNSKSFYSQNLKLYFDEIMKNDISNLRLLAYGENWKISLLLNTLQKVNLFISENKHKEKVKAQRLKTYTQLENISEFIEIDYPISAGGALFLEDIQKFSTVLNAKINQEILLNE